MLAQIGALIAFALLGAHAQPERTARTLKEHFLSCWLPSRSNARSR